MTSIDYNVDNYTITELLAILDLDDPDTTEIIATTNEYIDRFSPKRENNPQLVSFFENIQTKLVSYMNQLESSGKDAEYTPNEDQQQNWFKNSGVLPQTDSIQKNRITDRKDETELYDNNHVPMNREQLGVSGNYNVDVVQDTLNPNLENITKRFINLDSQFRQPAGGAESMSTDYTLDLSDPLTNVISLSVYSIQVPYTWYTIDYIYGNTCFWVINEGNTFRIFIEPGNYTPSDFCKALQNAFTNPVNFSSDINGYPKAFTYNSVDSTPSIATYNVNNGKITLYLNGWIDPANNSIVGISKGSLFDEQVNPYYTFFDISGSKTCYESGSYPCGSSTQGQTFNGTLGWVMGFRIPMEPIFSGGNTPVAVINLFGTKYFILVLDDYNQNHINNGLITITELSKSLSMPSYYNPEQPYICTPNNTNIPSQIFNNNIGNIAGLNGQTSAALGFSQDNVFNSLQDKLGVSVGAFPQVLPSAPRTLTQAQIYTINEIIKNRSKTISYRAKAPTNSDTFALIPIKYGSLTTNEIYVDFSGSMQDNKRIYFGPVDIDRMRIKLLDDRGNTVDLHGADWCITLISENLYQY
jgi:hypothetical protein